MAKMRVYQLAKELHVQSALILELLDRMGREVKSDLSVLDQDTAQLVRERVTSAIAEERKRLEEQRLIEEQQTQEAEALKEKEKEEEKRKRRLRKILESAMTI